ncbi:MAG: efflux RND transporter periplasmic adaptor subunit [Candidatus Omnitrophota bacterium]
MRNKIVLWFLIIFVVAGIVGFAMNKIKQKNVSDETVVEIRPSVGNLETYISCTGTILPKNRLEVKPPVNGRVESILVKEGDHVKVGQILAWMSSTERAALLDAARGKGEETLKYWQETYKPISLSAPIDGDVIVGTTQPGQTVTTVDAVIVLSDRLIVRAQVDEVDIGKIAVDQKAMILLDAYPDVKIKAKVDHIYHESETVNNVTIYKVDLIPEETPSFFRSGMNTTVDFVEQSRENVLLIPSEAVAQEGKDTYVLVQQGDVAEPLRVLVSLGISDDKNSEVLSGITQNDTLIVKTKKYRIPKDSTGKNPFMPSRKK